MAFELSNEMFINMKPSQIPEWKAGLSYFEQSMEAILFWENEMRKINEGTVIDGYWVHPWMYYHLNFFRAKLPSKEGGDKIVIPKLDDNFLYTVETYKEAEEKGRGVCMFGCRGFTKTTMLSSLSMWTIVKKSDSSMSINGGSSKDLNEIIEGFKDALLNIDNPLKIYTKVKNWDLQVDFSLTEKGTEEEYKYGRMKVTNADAGKSKKSEAGAGGQTDGFIVDEIGKFDPTGLLKSALPSFFNEFGTRGVPFLTGTGGNDELSEGAKRILENPEGWKMISMNWETLEKFTDLDKVKWDSEKNSKFCTFVPGQMSRRLEGIGKDETNLAEFLGVKSEQLSNIAYFKTNWEKADEYIDKLIASKETEREKNDERMYFPRKVSECFLTSKDNPFPVSRCIEKLNSIKENHKYRTGDFEPSSSEREIDFILSDKPIAEREYKGSVIDAPWMVFGDVPEGKVPANFYVAGLDDYKLDQSSTKSLGSLYIVQRLSTEIGMGIEKIVACLNTRPEQHKTFHEKIERGLTKYNAICCPEGIDTGFKAFLSNTDRDLGTYLCGNINPAQDLNSKNKNSGNNKWGLYPTKENKDMLLNAVINYSIKPVTVGEDEHGRKIVKYGVEFIEDPGLLEEMINFEYGGNYDRITAFGVALLYARHLDKNRVIPENIEMSMEEDDYYNKPRKTPKVALKKYTSTKKLNNYGSKRNRFGR